MTPIPKVINKTYKIYSGKNFINKPFFHSDGSIYTQVTVYRDREYCDLNISCKIRDCERTVGLAFSANDDKDYQNSLYKIDTIIRNLTNLKEGITKGYELKQKLKNGGL